MAWTIETFQADALAWQNYNFPHTTAPELLLGMNEELGELAAALLSGKQDDIKDSLADIGVFGANFANKLGISIPAALNLTLEGTEPPLMYPLPAFLQLTRYQGELCHAMLKIKQGIRGQDEEKLYRAFARVWYHLEWVSNLLGFHFETILFETWDMVRQRDWRRHPETGGLAGDGAVHGNDVILPRPDTADSV